MPPPGGSICMGVDHRNHLFAPGLSPGWLRAPLRSSQDSTPASTGATLEATKGQIYGSLSQLPCKCHQKGVASVGDLLKICPWVTSRVESDSSKCCASLVESGHNRGCRQRGNAPSNHLQVYRTERIYQLPFRKSTHPKNRQRNTSIFLSEQ